MKKRHLIIEEINDYLFDDSSDYNHIIVHEDGSRFLVDESKYIDFNDRIRVYCGMFEEDEYGENADRWSAVIFIDIIEEKIIYYEQSSKLSSSIKNYLHLIGD